MKNLVYFLWAIGMIFISSCSDNEENPTESVVDVCGEDYAEYIVGDVIFQTMHNPDGSEFQTASGESCGIAAVHDENINKMILVIEGEESIVRIHTRVTALNEQLEFELLEYRKNDASYSNLVADHLNFILFEEMDSDSKRMKGEFRFKVENDAGESKLVSNGTFNCSYQSF